MLLPFNLKTIQNKFMRKSTFSIVKILFIFLIGFNNKSYAQLSMSGQLRIRAELRDGYGTILPKTAPDAIFTSQRTRLNALYNMYRVKFFVSLQDVGVWGQDASTINATTVANNDGLQFHEAWAEISLTDTSAKDKWVGLKAGRQEIIYDDQRLIGNADFLQQARTFDAAVFKFENKNYLLHLGISYNQNQQNASGTVYNPVPPTGSNYSANSNGGTMYKSFEYLYASRKLEKGNLSFLFFSDQFSKYQTDTINSVATKVYEAGTWARATTGLYFNNTFNKLAVTASVYYQFGDNSSGQSISAELLSAFFQYSFDKKFNTGTGVDFYSGGMSGSTSNAFDPLYGSPHRFAGSMDYYYAASGFGKNGLIDYYLKTKYKPSDKYLVTADLHLFNSAASVTGFSSKNLGQEIDFLGSYNLTRYIAFEAAYCHYFSSSLLTSATVKNVANASQGANWAAITINIKPEFLLK